MKTIKLHLFGKAKIMTDIKQHLQKIFIYHIINYYMREGGKGFSQFKEEIKEPQIYMEEMNVEINSQIDKKKLAFSW